MRQISEKELERLRKKGGVDVKRRRGKKKKSEPVATESKALSGAEVTERSAPALTPAPAIDMQPFAAMAASMAVRDADLKDVITNNTRAIERFKSELNATNKPAKPVAYRHKVVRDKSSSLIDYVDSIPMES